MSGGHYDYAYHHVQDMAYQMEADHERGPRAEDDDTGRWYPEKTPEREAFAKLLAEVAKAMKAIEWVDSGDCSTPHENKAIRDCLRLARCLADQVAASIPYHYSPPEDPS